jgi:hypothetical protein
MGYCPDCGWDGYTEGVHKPCLEDARLARATKGFQYPEDYAYAYGDEDSTTEEE